jgi:hypothetical protein
MCNLTNRGLGEQSQCFGEVFDPRKKSSRRRLPHGINQSNSLEYLVSEWSGKGFHLIDPN